jgi:hypothetical protein
VRRAIHDDDDSHRGADGGSGVGRFGRILAALAVVAGLVLLGPVAAGAGVPTWHFETLDGAGSAKTGHTNDLVGLNNTTVVFNGQLHAFTRDGTHNSLRHDWFDGTSWHFETVDGHGSTKAGAATTHDVGLDTAATVFGGKLHFVTLDGTTSSLRHDWFDGTTWHFETLDGSASAKPGAITTDEVGEDNAVAVVGTQLHVFSYDFTFGSASLRHDWWDGTSWHFETLDGAGSTKPGSLDHDVGQGTSVTVFNGQPHVFTLDNSASTLRHEWSDGAGWHFETLDGAASGKLGHTNDQIGTSNAATAYGTKLEDFTWDVSKRSLHHEWWDGTAWHFEAVDGKDSTKSGASTTGVGTNNAVAVFNGQLHVFSSTDAFSLRHDWWDGAAWHFETLDGPGSTLPGHVSDFAGSNNAAVVFGTKLEVFTEEFGFSQVDNLRHIWFS